MKAKKKTKRATSAPAAAGQKLWIFGLALALLLALGISYVLFESLLPIFLAFGLAYALGPLVDFLERKGLGRSLAVALLMLVLGVLGAALLAFIVPALIREGREFAASFPQDLAVAANRLAEFGNRHGLSLPLGAELMDAIKRQLENWAFGENAPGMAMLRRLFSSLGGAAAWSVNLLIIPVFFFFFLRDLPAIRQSALGLVPRHFEGPVVAVSKEINRVFSGYIRGQLTVALVLGIVFAGALSIMQVRFGLVIGLLAGFLNIIPYVGQATGLILSLLMVLVEGEGLGRLLAVPLVFAVVNFVEGTFITPQVVGNKVGLSAPQTMLALILGAEMAGLLGMIIAVPVAASFKVLLLDLIEEYKKSRFYGAT